MKLSNAKIITRISIYPTGLLGCTFQIALVALRFESSKPCFSKPNGETLRSCIRLALEWGIQIQKL